MRVLGFTLLLTFASMAGCIDLGSQAAILEAPRWASGYAFSYVITGSYQAYETEDGETNRDSGVLPPTLYAFEVLNTTLRDDSADAVYLVGSSRHDGQSQEEAPDVPRESRPGLEAVRQRDLADVPISANIQSTCQNSVCSYGLGLNVRRGPSWNLLDFPLERGKSWGAPLNERREGGLDLAISLKASGMRAVQTKLGTTQAMRIDYTIAPTNLEEWKRDVRAEAEEDGEKIEKFDYSYGIRGQLYYSADYLSIVRVTTTRSESFDVAGVADGEKFASSGRHTVNTDQVLTGARFVARPERDLDYIARVLVGKIPLVNPAGQTGKPIDYRLALAADQRTVNAADGAKVQFNASLEPLGNATVPSDTKITWRILDYTQRGVTAGEGGAFTHEFDKPGYFTIEAEARDAKGHILAAAATDVTANWQQKKTVECFPVALLFYPEEPCPPLDLPVHAGVQSLRVLMRPTSVVPLPAFGSNELVIRDAAGNEVATEGPCTPQVCEATLSDFGPYAVGDEEWTATRSANFHVLQDVEFEVEILYGTSEAAAGSRGDAAGLFGAPHKPYLGRFGYVLGVGRALP